MPRTSTSIWCVQACGLRGRTSIAAMACKYIRCQSGRIPVHRLGPDMGAMERSLWARSCWIDGAPTCQREHRRRVDAAGSVNTRSSHPTAHCGNRRVYNRWQHHSDLCQSLDDDRTRDRIELARRLSLVDIEGPLGIAQEVSTPSISPFRANAV